MSAITITYETARGASIDAAMSALVGLWATVQALGPGGYETHEILVESYDEASQTLFGTFVVEGLPIGKPWSAPIDSIFSIEV